jgi:hypothetical protein
MPCFFCAKKLHPLTTAFIQQIDVNDESKLHLIHLGYVVEYQQHRKRIGHLFKGSAKSELDDILEVAIDIIPKNEFKNSIVLEYVSSSLLFQLLAKLTNSDYKTITFNDIFHRINTNEFDTRELKNQLWYDVRLEENTRAITKEQSRNIIDRYEKKILFTLNKGDVKQMIRTAYQDCQTELAKVDALNNLSSDNFKMSQR